MENVTIFADQFTYLTAEYLNDPVDLFPFRLYPVKKHCLYFCLTTWMHVAVSNFWEFFGKLCSCGAAGGLPGIQPGQKSWQWHNCSAEQNFHLLSLDDSSVIVPNSQVDVNWFQRAYLVYTFYFVWKILFPVIVVLDVFKSLLSCVSCGWLQRKECRYLIF